MTTVADRPALAPRKATFFGVCLALELLALAFLPLSSRVPARVLLASQACLAACLLAGALTARRVEAARPYSQVLDACLAGSTAVLLGALFGGRTLDVLSLATVSPAWIALSRLSEVAWRTLGVVAVITAGGASLRSICLTSGRLAFGLGVGLAAFAIGATLAFAPGLADPGARIRLLSLAPWIIVFALSDGFGEELLFRGLFLPRFEPILGKGWSNVLAATAYTLLHAHAAAGSNVSLFIALVSVALTWGWLMQKTGSVWGSALFHAGADCLLILGIDGTF